MFQAKNIDTKSKIYPPKKIYGDLKSLAKIKTLKKGFRHKWLLLYRQEDTRRVKTKRFVQQKIFISLSNKAENAGQKLVRVFGTCMRKSMRRHGQTINLYLDNLNQFHHVSLLSYPYNIPILNFDNKEFSFWDHTMGKHLPYI